MRFEGPLSDVPLIASAPLGALPALSLAMACVLSTQSRGCEGGRNVDSSLLSKYACCCKSWESCGESVVLYAGDGGSGDGADGALNDGLEKSWRRRESLVSGIGDVFEAAAKADVDWE